MDFTGADALGLAFRWLHIIAAMAAVGGMIFMRFALLPAAAILADPQRRELQEAIRRRWAKVVMAAIGILLISGFYNFIVFTLTAKQWPEAWRSGPGKLYQFLFGIKFFLAIAIFFISSALAGRSAGLAKIRERATFWVTVNLVMAMLLVLISNEMRMLHNGPPLAPAAQTSATAPTTTP